MNTSIFFYLSFYCNGILDLFYFAAPLLEAGNRGPRRGPPRTATVHGKLPSAPLSCATEDCVVHSVVRRCPLQQKQVDNEASELRS
jgi:hypothetical protein